MKKTLMSLLLFMYFIVPAAFADRLPQKINCLASIDKLYDPSFKELELDHCGINNATIINVVSFVNTHHVNIINLSVNNIGSDGAKQLAKIKGVHSLLLSSNHIGTSGAEFLAKSDYKLLRLDDNEIGKKGIIALADSDKEIDVGDNSLDSEDIIYLLKNKSRLNLNLKRAAFDQKAIEALAKNSTLNALDLSYSNIKESDISFILKNKQLQYLNLAGLGLVEPNFLSDQKKLLILTLSENNLFGPPLDSIMAIPRLMWLDLSYNNLTSREITEMLINLNHGLDVLDLSHNKIDDSAIDILTKKKDYLGSLSFIDNEFSWDGYDTLTEMMHYTYPQFKAQKLSLPATMQARDLLDALRSR